jgi:hypothetical protein
VEDIDASWLDMEWADEEEMVIVNMVEAEKEKRRDCSVVSRTRNNSWH